MSKTLNSPSLQILRILTPAVIKSITHSVEIGKRPPLTTYLLGQIRLGVKETKETTEGAIPDNVLEFPPHPTENSEEEPEESAEGGGHEEEVEVVSLTMFILKQKEKLRESQNKLKRKEVLELYSESSRSLNSEGPSQDQEDILENKDCGTLMNKKQY